MKWNKNIDSFVLMFSWKKDEVIDILNTKAVLKKF